MRRFNCFFFVSILFAITAHSQNKQLDKAALLQTPKEVGKKAIDYLLLAESASKSNLDSSFYYAKRCLALVGGEDKKIIPQAEYFIAAYYIQKGVLDSGLYFAEKNIPILKEKKDRLRLLVDYSNLLGHYYMRKNRQKDALDAYYYSLKIADETGDPLSRIKAGTNIGWVLMELNQFEKAIIQFRQAASLMTSFNLNRYATIYNNLASCYGELKKYDSAKKYVQAGIDLARTNNDLSALANGLHILGTLYQSNNQYDEALSVFLQAKEVRLQMGDPFFIVSDMAVVAELYSKTKQWQKGLAVLEEALAIAEQNKLQSKLQMLYESLAVNYEAAGNYRKAAEMYKAINSLKDTVYTHANSNALAEIQTKYETEKKERQIQQQQFELEKKNYWLVAICCFLVLGGLLGYSFYHRKKLQQEKLMQAAIMKQQDLATSAVLEAEETERQRIAKDLHDGVGQMMSAAKMNLSAIESRLKLETAEQKTAFQNIIGLIDESCKEVRSVSHNMMPNALLKGSLSAALQEFLGMLDQKALKVHLYTEGLDTRFDANIESVFYRIIQECVNNVIKHSGADTLDITIINDGKEITATIEDNGKGFDADDYENMEGIGLKSMRSRIGYLKGTIDINSTPGQGTLIALHIPLSI